MRLPQRKWMVTCLLAALAGVAAAPAYTIYAGLTLDVHQDIPDGSLPGGRLPNDFHVEGVICTASGVAPVLVNHLDDLFPHFQYNLTPLGGCWWRVTADWWLDPTMPGIPFCYVAHLGLLFQVEDQNVIIDLVGWWTLDGMRVGDIHGGYANGGFVPIPGFDVTPLPDGQVLRIGNGTIPPIEPPVPPVPPAPWPIPIELVELELMAVPPSFLPPDWFQELRTGGAQEQWPWIAVADPAGNDIGRQNPVPMGPDSFFDVFLSLPPGGGQFAPVQSVVINPGDLLLVRSQRMFINNAGQPDPNMGLWVWHIHEAQGPEACCFPDGSCRDLAPVDCTAWGGFPMGLGTRCSTTICPTADLGACCYGDPPLPPIQCVVTDPLTCQQQFNGMWMGPGTTCDDFNGNGVADICEGGVEIGACCYGDPPLPPTQCVVTDQFTCEQQYMGQWMGPGTNCDDNNGNGVADICEGGVELGACCYGQTAILCVITDQLTCEQQYWGVWKGPGTNCDDLNGNGVADICEEPVEQGACCFTDPPSPQILCVITDQLTCEQQLNGEWKGPGTTCDDLNGNGVADICEEPVEPGACCYGTDVILCAITDQLTCEQQLNGQWMGPGTTCDDWNGNGIADICEPAPYYIEFSVDIGSDRELSDPLRDGDEGFDPGDVYWWRSAPVDYPGRDGFKNDLRIFGFDPPPTPPDPNYTTAVPVGQGGYQNYWEFFDLDGHDQIDVNLADFFPPGQPLPGPIPMFPSQCIHRPVHVLVSFDDDMAPGWPAWDVPVTMPSPAGNVYGTTGGRDEVIGVVLHPAVPVPPFPLVGMYRFVDEIGVHQSLAPNPDVMFEEDDDVDSLDIVPDRDGCPFWYFTADAEAHLGLLPGGVYLVTPMGPQLVIDPSIHLGLPPDVDLDAIEFTWLREPGGPAAPFLALVFSVDEDDPITPWDESGGLPPNMLFGSYLLGWHFPLSDPLPDDIDAVTIWRETLRPICRGDANCDGVINWRDIDFFVAAMNDNVAAWEAFFAPGVPTCPFANNDVNGDGTVNWRDIDPLVAVMNTVCP